MPRKSNKTGDDRYNAIFPTKLRSLMEENGTKQEDLVPVLKVKSRQSVTGYIDGSTLPTSDKITALAKFFNVTTDYLLTNTTVKTFDSDLRSICDHTGLSEKSLEIISHIDDMNYIYDLMNNGTIQFDFKFPLNIVSYGKKILNDFIENHLLEVVYTFYCLRFTLAKAKKLPARITRCIEADNKEQEHKMLRVNNYDIEFDPSDTLMNDDRELYQKYIMGRLNSLRILYLSLSECMTRKVSSSYYEQMANLTRLYDSFDKELEAIRNQIWKEINDQLDTKVQEYQDQLLHELNSQLDGDINEQTEKS